MEADTAPYAPLTTMTTSRDAPNPLRPYYIPPSIGLPPDPAANGTAAGSRASPPHSANPTSSFGSSARDILSDLDYKEYLNDASPSAAGVAKKLVDQALWNYTSVLLAQPFEVAKTILQCHSAAGPSIAPAPVHDEETRRHPNGYRGGRYPDYPSDASESDDDSPSYFTSTAPTRETYSSRSPPRRRNRTPSRSHTPTPTPSSRSAHPSNRPYSHPHKLELRHHDSLLEVLSQLWTREGAWGVWKGANATFVYNVLLKTIESWTRSLLSALLNLPDPGMVGAGSGPAGGGGLDIVDSPSPLASLGVAVVAAGIAGCVLAPLDIVRTKLILTPTTAHPRAILPSLRSLPSLVLPPSLLPITALHSAIPPLISASTPLLLRHFLRVDPVLTPATYSVAAFAASLAELFVKLPLETVLRRGQVAALREGEEEKARREGAAAAYGRFRERSRGRSGGVGAEAGRDDERGLVTVVDVGPYRGVLGTMWYIVREEGTAPAAVAVGARGKNKDVQDVGRRKGQGIHGLWRGWRVGFWGLVGVWGAAALGQGAGGEF